MVYLSKIYTKSGDKGETSLGDGVRVPKTDPRVEAYGTVDELNSVMGLLVAYLPADCDEHRQLLGRIQNDLFDVGADLCVPQKPDEEAQSVLRVQSSQVEHLEKSIDRLNADLTPLNSFVLPGGQTAAAWCHLARTVCRRAEREVAALLQISPLNQQVMIYLNRLSDLLFVLARVMNDNGRNDVLWKPGAGRDG